MFGRNKASDMLTGRVSSGRGLFDARTEADGLEAVAVGEWARCGS